MNRPIRNGRMFLILFDVAAIAFSIIMFSSVSYGFDRWIATISLGASYFYIVFYTFSPQHIVKGVRIYLSLELAFSFFYYILFFWPYQKELFDIGTHYYESSMVNYGYPGGANKAMLMSLAGFAAFHLGNLLVAKYQPRDMQVSEPLSIYMAFDIGLAIFMPIFFALFIFSGAQPDDLGRYQKVIERNTEQASSVVNGIYLLTILLCLVASARIISARFHHGRLAVSHWTMLATIVLWMLWVLLQGDRNNFLVILLALVGGVSAFLRELRWPIIIAALFPAMLVYNTVEVFRMLPDPSIQGLMQAWQEASQKSSEDSSFALTTLTLRATFDIVPYYEPFSFGYYKLIGFAGIVPLVRGMLLNGESTFTNTSEVIAHHVLGPNPTWSLGTNPISDLYMEFGSVGVVLGMGLIGYLVARTRNLVMLKGPSSNRIFLYIALFALMSQVPRYSVDSPVRFIVWGALIFWIYDLVKPSRKSAICLEVATIKNTTVLKGNTKDGKSRF